MEGKVEGEFQLPGFRFHPTEEELVGFYLRKKVQGQQFGFDIIGTLDLYRYDPWQLPGLSFIGEREWFFFVPVDKKCAAARRSRLTGSGYWKATGSDRPIRNKKLLCIGLKKTLVFYRGKAPRGEKTDWIMNEYRMLDSCPSTKKDVVLCRIYKKPTSQKTLEQRSLGISADEKPSSSSHSDISFLNYNNDYKLMNFESKSMDEEGFCCENKSDDEELLDCMAQFNETKMKPPELEVPKMCVEKLFCQQSLVSPWTPSVLLSTPKDYWSNISDGTCIPSKYSFTM
ncbi:hypothetical protein SUGI_0478850 [Cryptomeria japonica]|uniref:NAC domain-containing protein 22 isoform X1 n=1 Tax=Cryptomeria japonica TaxID=3369 RepID=UPI002408954A|nr:NAC domain-containing protein 22 isoform X1 [Cryptomeria japonica]GLJ25015.1 hypothetical protein SUGI_0478850 [Cryptomeria japonica]